MRVGDETLYVLIDTPGFQRARRALAWMKQHETSASDRPDIVRKFVLEHQNTDSYPDECELLRPLVDGAGILYVVDGSQPYGDEYEAEMEILRWTGQPSMAVINMIGEENHIDHWRDALGQYFRIVREFNALYADFEKRLNLLRGFGELNEHWRAPLERAVASLEQDRNRRGQRSAEIISQMLIDMLNLTVAKRFGKDINPDDVKASLLDEFRKSLADQEQKARLSIESTYDYHELDRVEQNTQLLDSDLFSEDTWSLWGLNKKQLITTGAIGGAAVGAGIDLAVGGADFFLGTVVGGVLGSASAIYSNEKLASIEVLGLPLGGNELTAGPTRNINFPYVVLGRALYHHALIESRTHARRDIVEIESNPEKFSPSTIPDDIRKQLEKLFVQIRRQRYDDSTSSELTKLIASLILRTGFGESPQNQVESENNPGK